MSNIIKFELKSQLNKMFIFTSGLCLILIAYILGMYNVFIEGKETIKPIFEKIPEAFLNAFGLTIDNFFSYLGILVFAYVYLGLVGAIMSCNISLTIFSKENRTHDFLLTKPIERKQIFLSKLITCLVINLVSFGIVLLTSIILYLINGDCSFKTYILIIFSLLLSQLIFLFIGLFLGIFLKKVKNPATLATGVGVLAFIINALVGIVDIDFFNIFNLLQYFSPAYIAKNDSFELLYVILFIILSTSLIMSSYIRFERREF